MPPPLPAPIPNPTAPPPLVPTGSTAAADMLAPTDTPQVE
jgi:hypothetical protein